ncbi:MAG: glycerol kinase GlpK [Lachnospiraceae bacterium]|nr:glycerol kinase GlpK [Lachnospiraceae bacterium]
MHNKYIVSLDQGTTSSRCIIFDHNARIISSAQLEFSQIFPKAGWIEHNPDEIFSSQLNVMFQALANAKLSYEDIAAIGITNQRETTVIWDKETGRPIYNAIVWQCRRTSKRINEIVSEGLGSYIQETTGLIPDAYFSATKIEWILDNVDGARELAEQGRLLFGTIDTWLMWKLSNGTIHATDYTNASRTMLFNIHTLEWDKTLLETFNIPREILPKVQPSGSLFGYVDSSIFINNADVKIPICGVAGDQQSALFGQCCFLSGMAKNTYGTGCFLLMNTGHKAIKSKNGLITTIAATSDDNIDYALEGSVFIAGAAIKWLRDELRIIDNPAETEALANSVKDTCGMVIVPSFTGMGAPYWNQDARGTVFGLTRGTSKAHFVRATLESLAYQTYDVITAMEKDSGITLSNLHVDGGASNNNFLMQFQSDILDAVVSRPSNTETTALGAAFLAGLNIGYWKDKAELINLQNNSTTFTPNDTKEHVDKLLKHWHKAVKASIAWADDK